MLNRSVLLLLAFLAVAMSFGIFARPSSAGNSDIVRQPKSKPGSLKLCPPGGPSFLDAFNLICPMRRRRRSIDPSFDDSSTLEKTMHKCCDEGCEFSDIFPICNPFG
ncbi:unnamed protein product [Haemonchus placei]|uniref:IlGF domain-containing protein n=2 Tax=Haemonchus TaxID=6288 RepID=A0A0N4WXK9_HAEPC|nr:CRE-INS-18 protein [Haemonchus contortus]VDO60533.1 unnamed protein product [Haemonchus placei]